MCDCCKEKKEKFYITTPIYYPSDKLHIGHTYCTVATDAMARYKRLRGYDVMFLTGTDEHGQKIENRAKEVGITPKQFVDQIVEGERGVLDLWKLMNISYDRFIRTTDEYHVKAIQRIFKKMYENGDIYKGKYTGMYCTPCESFWTESQLKDGKCPDCGREVQPAEEEAYFFRLSKYAQPVRDLLMNTDYLQPRSRVNEMVRNFIDPGLEDLCVSRTSFTWGIPVDFDPGHVVYVWVDALFNYTTALGFENDAHHDYDRYWPADVHFVGKEIVRFHSIVWPAMLMSMGMPLPKKVFGHGWLLLDGLLQDRLPVGVVEALDPMILASKVREVCDCCRCETELTEVPPAIAEALGEELVLTGGTRRLYVTVGQFSTVRLERGAQLAVQSGGYCMPTRECCDDEGCEEDPCELFSRVDFPVRAFYPEGSDCGGTSCCGSCGK